MNQDDHAKLNMQLTIDLMPNILFGCLLLTLKEILKGMIYRIESGFA
jgi:hypothetical protein